MKLRKIACLLAVILIASCSAQTIYKIFIDGLSFIPQHQVSVVSLVPDGIGLTIYILPDVYLDLTSSGPDENTIRGIKVTNPVPPFPPAEAELTIQIGGRISIENLDAVATIPSTNTDVYLAHKDATNIYTEGTSVLTVVEPLVGPGAIRFISFSGEITLEDPHYDLIEPGASRIGVRLRIDPALGTTVDIRYTIEEMFIQVSARPFGLIP